MVHTPPPSAAQAVADIAAAHRGGPALRSSPRTVANPTSFDEVYDAAEIQPPAHGFTIMKVGEMLRSEHIRNLPKDVKRSSVLVALEAAGAPLQDVIEDAVKRDRALDTFERVQEKALDELEAQKSQENQQIQAEMDRILAEHRARIQANNDAVAKEKERFYRLASEKAGRGTKDLGRRIVFRDRESHYNRRPRGYAGSTEQSEK